MKKIVEAVEKNKQLILDAEDYIWKNPETGFKEYKTTKYLAEKFKKLGYELYMAEGITGFYTVIDTKREGPEILFLGEMDSVICPEHPDADTETGAVHACGHCAQCAGLLGIAAALKEEGILDELCGKIKLCVVPAEELLELDYRTKLMKEGKIKHIGGKAEYMSRGYFADSDIAILSHPANIFTICGETDGVIVKTVTYKGVASHAASPWEGKNALYAATCGINAVNAIRETFKEDDIIRVHPIITNGGSMVNAIPATVKLESYVRGRTYDALIDSNRKVNQALCGAAVSLGVNIDITDISGCSPLINNRNMIELYKEAASLSVPHEEIFIPEFGEAGPGATDMGNLSQIMPVIHIDVGGAVGTAHGSDFYIEDPVKACVESAEIQMMMLYLLLKDNAKRANRIIKEYTPQFDSIDEYLDFVDKINSTGERIGYREDGTIIINN